MISQGKECEIVRIRDRNQQMSPLIMAAGKETERRKIKVDFISTVWDE